MKWGTHDGPNFVEKTRSLFKQMSNTRWKKMKKKNIVQPLLFVGILLLSLGVIINPLISSLNPDFISIKVAAKEIKNNDLYGKIKMYSKNMKLHCNMPSPLPL